MKPSSSSFFSHFEKIEDPRVDRTKKHDLSEILFIAICTIITGLEGFEDMVDFAQDREEWLRKFLKLEYGIPSESTFRRVLAKIDPTSFSSCFLSWIESIRKVTAGQIISIDGKVLKASNRKSPINMVSAWTNANGGLVLGQQRVDTKSNEIKSIPKLLEILALNGCIVTIDAIGCQSEIIDKIQEKGADYLISLKGNQEETLQEVKLLFEECLDKEGLKIPVSKTSSYDVGHGREEIRRYYCSSEIEWMATKDKWKGIKSVAMVESERTVSGKTSTETRFFISSIKDIRKIAKAIRSHWAIENNLHWSLDVSFKEDCSQKSKGHTAENVAILRRAALTMLKQDNTPRMSIRRKQAKSARNEDYLSKILFS